MELSTQNMIFDISSEHVRTTLRVYFTAIIILIGLIGDSCCSLRARLSVIRNQHVSMHKMTGWLSGFNLFAFGWKLQAVPGGWIGVIMTIVTLLSLTSDLAVAGLVKSVLVPSRCDFGKGLVIGSANTTLITPSPNGAPVFVVTQAQLTSLNNTGLEGIYRKVNNATNFRADEEDVLGAWTCADEGGLLFDPSYSAESIVQSLYSKGLLFSNDPANEATDYSSSTDWFSEPGTFDHLVLWDSNQGSTAGQPFEVRASVDMATGPNTNVEMWSFHCTMNATEAEDITSTMAAQKVLQSWAMYFQGSVYDGAGTSAWPNTGQIIARILNTMTMVAGGMNSLQSVPLSSSATDTTQGCTATRTSVPTGVVAMVLALFGIVVFFLFFWIYLRTFIHFSSLSQSIDPAARKKIDEAPNDLVDWMTHAVRETATGGGVPAKEVKGWNFGLDGHGYGLFGPSGPTRGVQFDNLNPGWSNVDFGRRKDYLRVNDSQI